MHFKHITPADYPALKRFFARQPYSLSPYALASLLVWSNKVYQPYGAVEGDTLIIYAEYPAQREKRHLILPVYPGREFGPRALHRLADALGHRTYGFVPQQYIESHGLDQVAVYFTVTPDPGYDDYVYRTKDLALLKGNKYSKKTILPAPRWKKIWSFSH